MTKNGNKNKHTRNTFRRMNFLINCGYFNMNKTVCCGGGMKLSDIGTKNGSEDKFNRIL